MKKDLIPYTTFQQLDLRVGQIKEVKKLENADKLLQLMVDLGEDYGRVQILSGIAEWYAPDDIIGKKFIFLANLEPRKIRGELSNGMIIAASPSDTAVLIPVPDEVPCGTI